MDYLNTIIIKMFPEKENTRLNQTSPIKRRLTIPGQDDKNGYAITTKIIKKDTSTQSDRIFMEQATNPKAKGYIGPGTCISSTDKGSRFLILPVYQDEHTPPREEEYQLRYISFHSLPPI